MNIIQLRDHLTPRPARERRKSLYELYPLPFFKRQALCTWDVTPSGDYFTDCETGRGYAKEFLRTCDGTDGWSMLIGHIVADMIRAGTNGAYPDGHPKINGIVVGFMDVIGRRLCTDPRPVGPGAA